MYRYIPVHTGTYRYVPKTLISYQMAGPGGVRLGRPLVGLGAARRTVTDSDSKLVEGIARSLLGGRIMISSLWPFQASASSWLSESRRLKVL